MSEASVFRWAVETCQRLHVECTRASTGAQRGQLRAFESWEPRPPDRYLPVRGMCGETAPRTELRSTAFSKVCKNFEPRSSGASIRISRRPSRYVMDGVYVVSALVRCMHACMPSRGWTQWEKTH